MDSLVPTVRRALIDPLPEVRVAAARTFDQLHNTIGVKALDDILPNLLKKMVRVEHTPCFNIIHAKYHLFKSIETLEVAREHRQDKIRNLITWR